jgi:hypothetical protein
MERVKQLSCHENRKTQDIFNRSPQVAQGSLIPRLYQIAPLYAYINIHFGQGGNMARNELANGSDFLKIPKK